MKSAERFITYKDIHDIDLFDHFAKKYQVKKRVIDTLFKMCEQWGAPRTQEVLQTTTTLTYRQVRYIHRCILLHKELLIVLKRGGLLSEQGLLSRIEGREWNELVHQDENGEYKIAGTYRELVFRKA